nr:DUF723 domain-containing protein [SAR86 cluster bacterium]
MVRKLTRKEFILRAQNIHGDLYDYSKSDYINIRTKLTIICDVHGEFKQIPRDHISSKSGCPKCASKAMGAKLSRTTSNFIELAHETHNSKYNYSKANYKGNKNKIIIICPKHGEFTQIPKNHIHKNYGCPKCAPNKKLTIKEFIITANKIHNNKYDYSKAKYINTRTKLTIICPVHREFNQRPNDHISDSNGCPKCANNISRSESKWLDLLNIPNDQRQISIWIKGALF